MKRLSQSPLSLPLLLLLLLPISVLRATSGTSETLAIINRTHMPHIHTQMVLPVVSHSQQQRRPLVRLCAATAASAAGVAGVAGAAVVVAVSFRRCGVHSARDSGQMACRMLITPTPLPMDSSMPSMLHPPHLQNAREPLAIASPAHAAMMTVQQAR